MSQINVDQVASVLVQMGTMARRMPPAWDGARVTALASGPDGQVFGRMLPGRGLYLARDLKTLGITKPLPNVYERTPLARAVDALDLYGTMRGKVFDAERSAIRFLDGLRVLTGRLVPACAITSYNGIINARANGKADDWASAKTALPTVAVSWSSLFRQGGTPGVGTYANIPAGATLNRTNVGALTLGTPSPTGSDKKYLLTFGYSSSSTINMFLLVDLCVAATNINAAVTTAQTINSAALTRYTTGAGLLMTFDVTTALGTGTGAMVTGGVTYTDQDNVSSNVLGAWNSPASAIAQRLMPDSPGAFMALASGDYGIRAVQTFQLSTAHTAGVLALNIYKPLAMVPGIAASTYTERDSTTNIDGLTELVLGSDSEIGCLTVYVLPNSATTGNVTLFMRSCRG